MATRCGWVGSPPPQPAAAPPARGGAGIGSLHPLRGEMSRSDRGGVGALAPLCALGGEGGPPSACGSSPREGGSGDIISDMPRRPSETTDFARSQRRKPTEAEATLWRHLRRRQLRGHRFRRQQPIGPYFADFICLQARLIVELDGSQHLDHPDRDRRRDDYLAAEGFRVIRITNDKVFSDIDAVLELILNALE